MAAEHITTSLISRLSLAGPSLKNLKGYYRSKLFSAPFANNPLVAAASPVFSLLERLSLSTSLPPLTTIRSNIEHELNAFLSRINNKPYSEEKDVIAYYLLCATIDELIGKNYLRIYNKPAEFAAFTPASTASETGPEERFFIIIAHIQEHPNQYLELIEFAYYCLIAGFEGQFHGRSDGRLELDNLIETLYQLIQQHRVNPTFRLFNEGGQVKIMPPNRKPLYIMACSAVAILVACFVGSYYHLQSKAKHLPLQEQVIMRLDN